MQRTAEKGKRPITLSALKKYSDTFGIPVSLIVLAAETIDDTKADVLGALNVIEKLFTKGGINGYAQIGS